MKSILKGLIICFFAAISFLANAQTDTSGVEIYDLIYLKKGGVMKGEIMSFDEPTGGIVFKDQQGRVYSLSREEYSYFKENQVYEIRKKKSKNLLPRKENEFEFGIGLNVNSITISEEFDADEYYRQSNNGTYDFAACFELNGGKYFQRKHYLGASVDLALSSSGSYFAAGARYMHQYDAQKGNVGFYIPIEVKYALIKNDVSYFTADTTFSTGGFSYPSFEYVDISLSSVVFSVGHGFAFMLNDKKSFMLEAALFKHFVTSTEFPNAEIVPKSTFSGGGIRFAVKFNF